MEAAEVLHAANLCDDMTMEEVETEMGAVF